MDGGATDASENLHAREGLTKHIRSVESRISSHFILQQRQLQSYTFQCHNTRNNRTYGTSTVDISELTLSYYTPAIMKYTGILLALVATSSAVPLLLAPLLLAPPDAASVATASVGGLPPSCSFECFLNNQSVLEPKCKLGDVKCFCPQKQFISAIKGCVESSKKCSKDDK